MAARVFSSRKYWVSAWPINSITRRGWRRNRPAARRGKFGENRHRLGENRSPSQAEFAVFSQEMSNPTYQIKLPQFEGPFDLLLFFIERDELDIYNIPITKITNEFLDYIHRSESLNIELSSEFILFISTLMRIKAKMLLPRKELDPEGNEIDPRQELIDKILEYKRFKEAALKMSELEALRMLMVKRGNIVDELSKIGEEAGEGTEIQAVSLFKLMKAFERVARRLHE